MSAITFANINWALQLGVQVVFVFALIGIAIGGCAENEDGARTLRKIGGLTIAFFVLRAAWPGFG